MQRPELRQAPPGQPSIGLREEAAGNFRPVCSSRYSVHRLRGFSAYTGVYARLAAGSPGGWRYQSGCTAVESSNAYTVKRCGGAAGGGGGDRGDKWSGISVAGRYIHAPLSIAIAVVYRAADAAAIDAALRHPIT